MKGSYPRRNFKFQKPARNTQSTAVVPYKHEPKWTKYHLYGNEMVTEDSLRQGYFGKARKYFTQVPDMWETARNLYDDFNEHWFGGGR